MTRPRQLRTSAVLAVLAAFLGVVVSCSSTSDDAADAPDTTVADESSGATTSSTVADEPAAERPTIVLVHGAFADTSSWDPVATLLRDDGFDVVVPANPLRGPSVDTPAIRAAIDAVDGDVVVVAHSYGGVPVTNAAAGAANVRALVYVAAYVPNVGETLAQIQERIPGNLTPDRLVIGPYTRADGSSGVGATIAPAAFPDVFAADVPADRTAALAGTQSPLDVEALTQPSGTPAWGDIPSWYLVATADQIIPAELARSMAATAGSTVEEVDASHAVLLSKPDLVADLITRVAAGVSG